MNRFFAQAGLAAIVAAGSAAAGPAQATVKTEGTFTASQSCEAFRSIKKPKNPGNVTVQPGQTYQLLGKNKEPAEYYVIVVPGAEPPERWVKADCGTISASAGPTSGGSTAAGQGAGGGKPGGGAAADGIPFYVLALSWEPAFCEGKPDKTECRTMQDGSAATRQLSLHGLWPQPARNAYCGVGAASEELDKTFHWYDLPEVKLTPETRAALAAVMPGTQSVLERHEWTKHGSCYPADAETYYRDAVRLTTAINASAVGAYLAGKVGQQVSATELRAKFDEAYGAGAGQRVRLACDRDGGRLLLSEITIGLKGDIPIGTPLPVLILNSQPTDAGCPGGLLDPVGLQ